MSGRFRKNCFASAAAKRAFFTGTAGFTVASPELLQWLRKNEAFFLSHWGNITPFSLP
jgi:hypothetical protein